jgi:hypothetical protein
MQESARLSWFAYTFSHGLFATSMPSITALLHSENDARRLGRALETLRVCDEIVVVDHGSQDASVRIAREYGARVLMAQPNEALDACLKSPWIQWIFCLQACESIGEGLEATLLNLKSSPSMSRRSFSVLLREETVDGWAELSLPQTRLVPGGWKDWQQGLPIHDPSAEVLEGEILRFLFP